MLTNPKRITDPFSQFPPEFTAVLYKKHLDEANTYCDVSKEACSERMIYYTFEMHNNAEMYSVSHFLSQVCKIVL